MAKIKEQQWYHGLEVEREHRNRWAQEVFDVLTKSKKANDDTSIESGDSVVIGIKRTIDGFVTIQILDCAIRRHTSYKTNGSYLNPE